MTAAVLRIAMAAAVCLAASHPKAASETVLERARMTRSSRSRRPPASGRAEYSMQIYEDGEIRSLERSVEDAVRIERWIGRRVEPGLRRPRVALSLARISTAPPTGRTLRG